MSKGEGRRGSAGGQSGVLRAEQNLKMAASTHTYVRGSTVLLYLWLAQSGPRPLSQGPNLWICGDGHVGNLGPVAGKDGTIAVQILDPDQTVIGNPAHDIIRSRLELAMAARSSDLPGVTTTRMIERMVEGYEEAVMKYKAICLPSLCRPTLSKAGSPVWMGRHLASATQPGPLYSGSIHPRRRGEDG